MSKCEKTDVCTFFTNRISIQLTSHDRMRLKVQYCITDKTRCARYMVNEKLYKGYAPCEEAAMSIIDSKMRSMYPSDLELAEEVIALLCNE